MKICFLADGRSPIARNWIACFIERGHEVHLISSHLYDADGLPPFASSEVVPVALARFAPRHSSKNSAAAPTAETKPGRSIRSSLYQAGRMVFSRAHPWIGPLDLFRYTGAVRDAVDRIQPDLVHAMRLPYEGLLAAEALRDQPFRLLLSTWGNDLTLYAARYPLIGWLTRRALGRADALHPDCRRDLHLAIRWGFASEKPSCVLPGAGGIQTALFHPGPEMPELRTRYQIPADAFVVLNARGFRRYVRSDTFFRAIPQVRARQPQCVFVGVGMQDHPEARRWQRQPGIASAVRLLPAVSRSEMGDLFRMAAVTVSPSEHDGTPNTLIEGMACGAFPIAGDIDSVREWIRDGDNGLLCDPGDSEALTAAVLRAAGDPVLRARAAQINLEQIRERGEQSVVMARAEAFYQSLVADGSGAIPSSSRK